MVLEMPGLAKIKLMVVAALVGGALLALPYSSRLLAQDDTEKSHGGPLAGTWIVLCEESAAVNRDVASFPLRLSISYTDAQISMIGTFLRYSGGKPMAGEIRRTFFTDGWRISVDGTASERDNALTLTMTGGYRETYRLQADGTLAGRGIGGNSVELWHAVYLRER